jgi:hypothetical protein
MSTRHHEDVRLLGDGPHLPSHNLLLQPLQLLAVAVLPENALFLHVLGVSDQSRQQFEYDGRVPSIAEVLGQRQFYVFFDHFAVEIVFDDFHTVLVGRFGSDCLLFQRVQQLLIGLLQSL